MKQTEAELLQAIREQLRDCHGFDGDKVAADRKSALDYYFQRPRGDEVEGCSTVVSGDLSSMVEATVAQMMDAFSGPAIAEFDAFGAEDEDQAALESATVQHYVMGVNNGYMQFLTCIKDALLTRNGVVKVWVDVESRIDRVQLEGVSSEALGELLQPSTPNVLVELVAYDPDAETASLKVTTRSPKFRVKAIRPEDFLYPATAETHELDRESFVAERHVDTRSDLILRGFPKSVVNDIPPWTGAAGAVETPRKPGGYGEKVSGLDSSQERVEWFECYALVDSGDGTSERRRICVAGQDQTVLLKDEAASVVPYAVGSAIINPHELTGISLYDKLRQGQDVSTGLQRALLDNVEAINRPKLAALDGAVNQDDLDNQRVTGTIRVRASVGDVSRAVMPLQIPDISPGLLQNLEFQRSIRSEMGGASLDLATGNMQLNDRLGSQGLDRAYSVMEQLSAMMTRTIANTLVRSVFMLAHKTMRAFYSYPLNIKLGGRWLAPIPQQWPARESVTIRVGMSPGERTRRSAALSTLVEHQMLMASQGMDRVLVGLDQFYLLIQDWARSQDIPNPEKYYIDPRAPLSLAGQQAKQAESQAQKSMETQFLQQAVELEQLRSAITKYQTDVQYQFEYWREALKAEIEEAKIVGQATTQLLAGRQQAEQAEQAEPAEVGEGRGD